MDLIIVPSEHSKKSIADIVYNEADKNTGQIYRDWETDRKSTRLNSSHRL